MFQVGLLSQGTRNLYRLTNMTASGCNFSCLLGFVFLQPFFSLTIFFLAFIFNPGLTQFLLFCMNNNQNRPMSLHIVANLFLKMEIFVYNLKKAKLVHGPNYNGKHLIVFFKRRDIFFQFLFLVANKNNKTLTAKSRAGARLGQQHGQGFSDSL